MQGLGTIGTRQEGGEAAQEENETGQAGGDGQQSIGGQTGGGQQGLWTGVHAGNSSILGGNRTEHTGGGGIHGHLLKNKFEKFENKVIFSLFHY